MFCKNHLSLFPLSVLILQLKIFFLMCLYSLNIQRLISGLIFLESIVPVHFLLILCLLKILFFLLVKRFLHIIFLQERLEIKFFHSFPFLFFLLGSLFLDKLFHKFEVTFLFEPFCFSLLFCLELNGKGPFLFLHLRHFYSLLFLLPLHPLDKLFCHPRFDIVNFELTFISDLVDPPFQKIRLSEFYLQLSNFIVELALLLLNKFHGLNLFLFALVQEPLTIKKDTFLLSLVSIFSDWISLTILSTTPPVIDLNY